MPQCGSSLFLTLLARQQLQRLDVSCGLQKQAFAAQNLHRALESQDQGAVENRSQCAPERSSEQDGTAGAFPAAPPACQRVLTVLEGPSQVFHQLSARY